jgi:hypothetical protein
MGGSGGTPQISTGRTSKTAQQLFKQGYMDYRQFVRQQPLARQLQAGALASQAATAPIATSALGTGGPVDPQATIAAGGAGTPAQIAEWNQAARAAFAARGNVGGNQAVAGELQNRIDQETNRFNQALNQINLAQGIQHTGLNQLGAAQSANVAATTAFWDPGLSAATNIATANLQAQSAAAQANQGKQSGLIGGGASGASSILSAVLPILLSAA